MENDITTPKQEQLTFEDLFEVAEAVVAVEILAADYTATVIDGPMVATAKVLKSLKGPYATGDEFGFWQGPEIGALTYQPGDYRILFVDNISPYKFTSTIWTFENQRMMTDFFIDKDSIPALSEELLKSFLREIQESGVYPGKVVFKVD